MLQLCGLICHSSFVFQLTEIIGVPMSSVSSATAIATSSLVVSSFNILSVSPTTSIASTSTGPPPLSASIGMTCAKPTN